MAGNKKILIIEDDEDIRELLKFLLEKESFQVEQAVDGEQASLRISNSTPPDLVLLDIMMPFRDGFEILEEIKSNHRWHSTPVLIITASDNEEHIARGFEEGINDYITKPFNPSELIIKIRKAINIPGTLS